MKKVLFLNLMAFKQTGGLEKFNRSFLKALVENEAQLGMVTESYSLCDTISNEAYYPLDKYKGFGYNKIKFTVNSILQGLKVDCIILGHINLAIIGFFIKLIAPSKKIVLICHGIEVWKPVSFIKKRVLKTAKRILAVSTYTKKQIAKVHSVEPERITVFHNTIDAYFPLPKTFNKNVGLLERYGFHPNDFVLYTLCRLSSQEQYKGYDNVIKALGKLQPQYPNIKYLIAGKSDDVELQRVKQLIRENKVDDKVCFAGYIDDSEIISHYQLGDVYIMPSYGEGFGIVFIEALACGCRVIAGNADGSIDAVANGELGKLVSPTSVDEIAKAIELYYNSNVNRDTDKARLLQQDVVKLFGFDQYKNRLATIISEII
jgi:glycosyltransferase involved in cell wall biosynthesis